MNILLTNDDGIQAVGLRSLYHALKRAGHTVHVVAPVTEMSAVGHAVTLAAPLRVKIFDEQGFYGQGVSGTPADCVKLGLTTLLPAPPDIVVSGINAGANVGVDILYSGTVSAATEGALMGLPALAVSYDHFSPQDLAAQGDWTAAFLHKVDWAALPLHCVLNLNFPDRPMDQARPLKVCPQTSAGYDDWYEERTDPRGRKYYWLTGVIPPEKVRPGQDRALLTEGHVTLTPLRFDFTDHAVMQTLAHLDG
ncbi:5'-nucleotidase SurE [Fundidesulfovibrio magnetotacticus]|uniref:5'-nucleotidase SurE n=1 Tax=Fundidesulfovibrio magnetotacticus TaxID=2730080 RepID=A0A6V8LV12_9BACT|nr:5'/3'-nucleotidase SurE [Fundidesulfovibrio magnetotacticus]GFK95584.1 5'-nucleotidase SurE [Fundidesulfovibrio magnetotacticus]